MFGLFKKEKQEIIIRDNYIMAPLGASSKDINEALDKVKDNQEKNMKKVVDVFISETHLNCDKKLVYSASGAIRNGVFSKPGILKAKLIIEIPEKKIEITESDFDSANACAFEYLASRYGTPVANMYQEKVKDELFRNA